MTSTQDALSGKLGTVSPARLDSLTGLRFIAAFLVFLFHAQWLAIFADDSVQRGYSFLTANGGAIGVSFFFVLSGFVLTWSARESDTARAFWRRRFVKIVPNHVVVFVAALALLIAAGGPVLLPEVIANFFLVHTWTPDLSNILYAVNGVTWSLSVELVFYICFPALIVLVRRIRPANLWRWAVGVAAFVALLPVLSAPFVPDQPRFPYFDISWGEMWLLNYGPPARVFEFVLGMILARIVLTGRWIRFPVPAAAALTVVAYVASLYLPMIYSFAALYVVPLGLLIAGIATGDAAGRRGWLATGPMRLLGEISYAFFLLHFTLLYALHGALSDNVVAEGGAYQSVSWGPLGGTLFLLGALVLSLGLSWLLYVGVERPAMRRWARPRRAAGTREAPR